MAGTPKRRAARESEAMKRLSAKAQSDLGDEVMRETSRQTYSEGIAAKVIGLLAVGIPIDDSQLNGVVVSPGVASRLGVHRSTIYEWQKKHPEFERAVSQARVESAHRIADKMLSLADVALAEPAMANSVRVAADILRWQAGVRNRAYYGDRSEVTVGLSYVDALRRVAEVESAHRLPLASCDHLDFAESEPVKIQSNASGGSRLEN